MLSIHKSYLNIVMPIIEQEWLHGISHITGGGIIENTERIIPSNQKLKIDWDSWTPPPIFDLIQKEGNVPLEDMRRSFNLGIGIVLIVKKQSLSKFEQYLKNKGEKYFLIGEIA